MRPAAAGGPPVVTLATLAAAALSYAVPGLPGVLILDRAAVAAGEVWRLATGNLVHFSGAHLAANALALGIAGGLVERRGRARAALLLLGTALAVSAAMLAAEPGVARFGGLSGVAFGALVCAACQQLSEPGWRRWLGAAALAGAALKLAADLAGDRAIADAVTGARIPVEPTSHAAAALFAAIALGIERRLAHRRAAPATG